MAWNHTIGRLVPVGMLLAGCTMGNPVTISDHVTITKGQNLQCYQLVDIDSQGRAEFRNIDTGDKDLFAHILAAPGQTFGVGVQSNHLTHYDFQIQSTDFAKQQATVLVETTMRK